MTRQRLIGVAMTGFATAVLGWAGRGAAIELTLGGRPLAVNGHLMVRQVFPVDDATPDERTLEQLWVDARYQWSDALSFETVMNVQNGGPATEETKGGVYSYRSVFQSVSPSVQFEEAYVDASFGALDLRAGLLKFAWGKLDRIQPVDVLNVERYADPFLLDEDERKIGVPAVEGSYYLPSGDWVPEEARLTVVWIPQYVPYRFPLVGERWFPPASVPPPTFDVPGVGTIPLGFQTVNSSPPSFQLDNCGYAGRASAFTAGVDYALYYYHGFDRAPAFLLTAEAAGDPMLEHVTAQTRLFPVFRTIDLWGLDAAYAWESFTFRFEAAYVSGRPFARDIRFLISNPAQLLPEIERALAEIAQGNSPVPVALPQSFAVRNAVEWGLGVDYTWNEFLLLLQVNQTDVLNNDVDLLIKNVDTVLSANLRRSFLHDNLTVQLIGVQGFESGYTLLMPRVTYRFWEHFEARAGYLFISGREASTIGQYKENDEGFIWLRYLL